MSVVLDTQLPAELDPRATQTMVAMRDKVRLATDTYLPTVGDRHPVVLVRLPYDKSGRYTFMPQLASRFLERGYAFVVQDVRGRFRSEGNTMPFLHEADDGYDTLSWIVEQPWCNGAVGMFGDSYYGFTQWAAVASGHPALRAIVPRVTTANLGMWLQGEVDPLYGAQYMAEVWSDDRSHTWEIDWTRRPLEQVFDDGFAAIGTRSAGFEMLLGLAREGRGLDPFGGAHPFHHVSIPTLHAVGWFDNISPDSMRDYMRLCADPRRAALQYLVADSTDHENYHLSDVPIGPDQDHDQDEAALERMLPRYVNPALDFFDVFLAGTKPASSLPRVRWHLGHDGWRESSSWPPPGARSLRLYLADPVAATSGAHGGRLSATPAEPGAVSWTHDPSDLVPSTVTNPFAFLFESPDERAVEERPDVLTFTAPPGQDDLVLAGPVTARLALSSEASSPHIFVKLVELAPDGRALMLLRGQVTMRADQQGQPVEVYLGHTGVRVRPGHRLRLHVAASDFPLYVPHPGTEENPWFATETRPNRLTLHTGGELASLVELTVLGGSNDD
jgi:predicted acyl esterase